MREELNGHLIQFKDQFYDQLESILVNKDSRSSSDKKGDDERRGEQYQKIKELANTEFQTKNAERISSFDNKFKSFQSNKIEYYKER